MVAAMTFRAVHLLFLAALAAGASYYLNHWLDLHGPAVAAWKGTGVGLLALWAATQARGTDGRLLAAALALGAAGDVLLETHGLTVGGVAFLLSHWTAVALYLRNRRGPLWLVVGVAAAVTLVSFLLPADRTAAPGIALYALGLGTMTGAALASRFALAGAGALLFAFSDLLIFARMGPMVDSALPGLLIWPTYFAGQALIAWAVARELRR
jgi:uncharacterized membrane protein YhhN